jgi:hypothetical protein
MMVENPNKYHSLREAKSSHIAVALISWLFQKREKQNAESLCDDPVE